MRLIAYSTLQDKWLWCHRGHLQCSHRWCHFGHLSSIHDATACTDSFKMRDFSQRWISFSKRSQKMLFTPRASTSCDHSNFTSWGSRENIRGVVYEIVSHHSTWEARSLNIYLGPTCWIKSEYGYRCCTLYGKISQLAAYKRPYNVQK